MKISLNSKFITGPYGGGVQFANYLKSYLEQHHHQVINHLNDPDIDIILHINPFPFLTAASAYSFFQAYQYKLNHPQTIIIHRINECDERKDTHYMNSLLTFASGFSDHVVFIASWLKPLLQKHGFNKSSTVILSGADPKIFNSKQAAQWQPGQPLKIVTHHWGSHFNKGYDIYLQLDKLLSQPKFRDQFQFTYIGNLPPSVTFRNTKIRAPLAGKKLASEIKKHHLYLTASLHEPAGMHHIEGALCGLPLLYRNSGALPEYCRGFGLEFSEQNFPDQLLKIAKQYPKFKTKMETYPHTGEHMGHEYLQLFQKLHAQRHTFFPRTLPFPFHIQKLVVPLISPFIQTYYRLRTLY